MGILSKQIALGSFSVDVVAGQICLERIQSNYSSDIMWSVSSTGDMCERNVPWQGVFLPDLIGPVMRDRRYCQGGTCTLDRKMESICARVWCRKYNSYFKTHIFFNFFENGSFNDSFLQKLPKTRRLPPAGLTATHQAKNEEQENMPRQIIPSTIFAAVYGLDTCTAKLELSQRNASRTGIT